MFRSFLQLFIFSTSEGKFWEHSAQCDIWFGCLKWYNKRRFENYRYILGRRKKSLFLEIVSTHLMFVEWNGLAFERIMHFWNILEDICWNCWNWGEKENDPQINVKSWEELKSFILSQISPMKEAQQKESDIFYFNKATLQHLRYRYIDLGNTF